MKKKRRKWRALSILRGDDKLRASLTLLNLSIARRRLVRRGKPQEVSNALWAMAKMKYDCPCLVNEVVSNVDRILSGNNPQEATTILYSLADMGYFEKSVFDTVARQAEG